MKSENQIENTAVLPGNHMCPTWQSYVSYLAIICVLPGNHMCPTWQSYDYQTPTLVTEPWLQG